MWWCIVCFSFETNYAPPHVQVMLFEKFAGIHKKLANMIKKHCFHLNVN
jgi:hypothetical protein